MWRCTTTRTCARARASARRDRLGRAPFFFSRGRRAAGGGRRHRVLACRQDVDALLAEETDDVCAPPLRTKWTRRVPHPVLTGHISSLGARARAGGEACLRQGARSARRRGSSARPRPPASADAGPGRAAASGARTPGARLRNSAHQGPASETAHLHVRHVDREALERRDPLGDRQRAHRVLGDPARRLFMT